MQIAIDLDLLGTYPEKIQVSNVVRINNFRHILIELDLRGLLLITKLHKDGNFVNIGNIDLYQEGQHHYNYCKCWINGLKH